MSGKQGSGEWGFVLFLFSFALAQSENKARVDALPNAIDYQDGCENYVGS